MRRQILAAAAISILPPMLAGCAIPLGISVASYTFDAFSFATEGKSMSDLALTNVTGEDCAMFRLVEGKAACRENTAEQQRKKDRFVADAGASTRHTDRLEDPGLYEHDTRIELIAAVPDLNQAPAESRQGAGAHRSDRVEIASDWVSEHPAAPERSITRQLQNPASATAQPAKAGTPVMIPVRGESPVSSMTTRYTGTPEPPGHHLRGEPSLALPLGLDLDTVLLSDSK